MRGHPSFQDHFFWNLPFPFVCNVLLQQCWRWTPRTTSLLRPFFSELFPSHSYANRPPDPGPAFFKAAFAWFIGWSWKGNSTVRLPMKMVCIREARQECVVRHSFQKSPEHCGLGSGEVCTSWMMLKMQSTVLLCWVHVRCWTSSRRILAALQNLPRIPFILLLSYGIRFAMIFCSLQILLLRMILALCMHPCTLDGHHGEVLLSVIVS